MLLSKVRFASRSSPTFELIFETLTHAMQPLHELSAGDPDVVAANAASPSLGKRRRPDGDPSRPLRPDAEYILTRQALERCSSAALHRKGARATRECGVGGTAWSRLQCITVDMVTPIAPVPSPLGPGH